MDEYVSEERLVSGVFQKSALERVRLPSTLKRIEYCAFQECAALKSVELPKNLAYIGKECFRQSGLEEVVFPPGLREVGPFAFYKCASLRHAELNEGLETLGAYENANGKDYEGWVFAETPLEVIRLPASLKTVELNTFVRCVQLKSVQFSEGLEKISRFAFGLSGLESVTTPASLRVIGKGAFGQCRALKLVELNDGLLELGARENDGREEYVGYVFIGSGIEHIRLPSSLRVIHDGTFYQCAGLAEIELQEGIERLSRYAFRECGLLSFRAPSTLRTICQCAFSQCARLRTVELNEGLEVLGTDEYVPDGAMREGVFERSALEHIKLPSTLKRIEYSAFQQCENLRRIELPDGLTTIGKLCFFKSGLEEVVFPPSVK